LEERSVKSFLFPICGLSFSHALPFCLLSTSQRYPPGSQHYLPRGTVKQYMMPEGGCWALEYAQGWIPPMMPFGLADVISSTLDFPTFGVTCWITAREMGKNLFKGELTLSEKDTEKRLFADDPHDFSFFRPISSFSDR